MLAEAAETDDLEQLINATLGLGLVRPIHLRAERNVLLDGQPFEECALLKDHPTFLARASDEVAAEVDRSTGWGEKASENIEQRRLAAARWSKQGQQASGFEVEAHIAQGVDVVTAGNLICHRDVVDRKVFHPSPCITAYLLNRCARPKVGRT